MGTEYNKGFEIFPTKDGWQITKAGEYLALVPNLHVAIALVEVDNVDDTPVSIIVTGRRFTVDGQTIHTSIPA